MLYLAKQIFNFKHKAVNHIISMNEVYETSQIIQISIQQTFLNIATHAVSPVATHAVSPVLPLVGPGLSSVIGSDNLLEKYRRKLCILKNQEVPEYRKVICSKSTNLYTILW